MTLSDSRFISLKQWLNRYFSYDVTPILISGDASFRRYFRSRTAMLATLLPIRRPP